MGMEQQWLFLNRGARPELALFVEFVYHQLLVYGVQCSSGSFSGGTEEWWPLVGGHQQLLLGEAVVLAGPSGEKSVSGSLVEEWK